MKRRDFLKTSAAAGVGCGFMPLQPLWAQTAVGKSMYDKIWEAHEVTHLGGITSVLHVDRMMIPDNGPRTIKSMLDQGRTIKNPELVWCVPDHQVSTSPERYTNRSLNLGTVVDDFPELKDELAELGIRIFGIDDPEQGIQHVVGPETGLTQPGMLMVAGDSHTCTHGALGCVSWGGETPNNVLLTGTVMRERARNLRVNMVGSMGPWVRPKDLILHTIGTLGADAGNRCAVEYAGPVVRSLGIEGRMSLCNLSIEMGAATGVVAPDDTTFEYMANTRFRPRGEHWDQAVAYWRTLTTDDDATLYRDETIDMTSLEPQVTWGTSPEQVMGISERVPAPDDVPFEKREAWQRALDYTKLVPGNTIADMPIDEVFIGSCVESRISDLRVAAEVVRGRQVAPDVLAWVVPGSKPVKAQAEAEGLDRIFKDAGFDWREPGCSKCYGSNGDLVAQGKRSVSNSNRNYVGRQGIDAITHLTSTPMAAAAAIAGRIVDVRRLMAGEIA
jgi:3-isopropylmalate/(R)-2-methylmalate dehydratase large subunit